LHIAETAAGHPTVVWREKGTEYALPQLFGVVVGLAFDLIWAVWRESGLDLDIPVGAVSKSTPEISEFA
jgi:hypothetical protein